MLQKTETKANAKMKVRERSEIGERRERGKRGYLFKFGSINEAVVFPSAFKWGTTVAKTSFNLIAIQVKVAEPWKCLSGLRKKG